MTKVTVWMCQMRRVTVRVKLALRMSWIRMVKDLSFSAITKINYSPNQVGHFFKAGLVFVHCLKDYMVLKILFHTANQIQTALIAISSCAK